MQTTGTPMSLEIDQLHIIRLLREKGWRPERIAAAVGISRATCYRRLDALSRYEATLPKAMAAR